MIKQLPASVRSHLRSGVAITSVTQCVEELLLNAVDAGAKCIAVRVDLSCFRIQVVDNGTGIAPEQLDKIGQRYSTSKCQNVEDLESLNYYGFRGEALASISNVSYIMEVNSRARLSAQNYCKIFQKGKSLMAVESTDHRPSPGTTVTVHNLFYNLPVRQKSTSLTLELERICYRVESLALMQPGLSITLRNDVTGSVLLQTHKTSGVLNTFSYLCGHTKSQSLSNVSHSSGHFSLSGYIGKESHYRKDLQFLYVNKRLVLRTRLHKLINKLLKKSLIVRQKQVVDNVEKLSPAKLAERYPMFILNIECPLTVYDITFDPRKTMVEFVEWDLLISAVEEMCRDFMRKENLMTIDSLVMESRKDSQFNSPINESSPESPISVPAQVIVDKIDEQVFDDLRSRGLKSLPIKRLFSKTKQTGHFSDEEVSPNKQCKVDIDTDTIDNPEGSLSCDIIQPLGQPGCDFLTESLPEDIPCHQQNNTQSSEPLMSISIELSQKTSGCSERLSTESSDAAHMLSLKQGTSLEHEKYNDYSKKTEVSQCQNTNTEQCNKSSTSIGTTLCMNSKVYDNNTSKFIHQRLNAMKNREELIFNDEKPKFNHCLNMNLPSAFRTRKNYLNRGPVKEMNASTKSILNQFRAAKSEGRFSVMGKKSAASVIGESLNYGHRGLWVKEAFNPVTVVVTNTSDINAKFPEPLNQEKSLLDDDTFTEYSSTREIIKQPIKSRNTIASRISHLFKRDTPKVTSFSGNDPSSLTDDKSLSTVNDNASTTSRIKENSDLHLQAEINLPSTCFGQRPLEDWEEHSFHTEPHIFFNGPEDGLSMILEAEKYTSLREPNNIISENGKERSVERLQDINVERLVIEQNENPSVDFSRKRSFLTSSSFLQTLKRTQQDHSCKNRLQCLDKSDSRIKSVSNSNTELLSAKEMLSEDKNVTFNHPIGNIGMTSFCSSKIETPSTFSFPIIADCGLSLSASGGIKESSNVYDLSSKHVSFQLDKYAGNDRTFTLKNSLESNCETIAENVSHCTYSFESQGFDVEHMKNPRPTLCTKPESKQLSCDPRFIDKNSMEFNFAEKDFPEPSDILDDSNRGELTKILNGKFKTPAIVLTSIFDKVKNGVLGTETTDAQCLPFSSNRTITEDNSRITLTSTRDISSKGIHGDGKTGPNEGTNSSDQCNLSNSACVNHIQLEKQKGTDITLKGIDELSSRDSVDKVQSEHKGIFEVPSSQMYTSEMHSDHIEQCEDNVTEFSELTSEDLFQETYLRQPERKDATLSSVGRPFKELLPNRNPNLSEELKSSTKAPQYKSQICKNVHTTESDQWRDTFSCCTLPPSQKIDDSDKQLQLTEDTTDLQLNEIQLREVGMDQGTSQLSSSKSLCDNTEFDLKKEIESHTFKTNSLYDERNHNKDTIPSTSESLGKSTESSWEVVEKSSDQNLFVKSTADVSLSLCIHNEETIENSLNLFSDDTDRHGKSDISHHEKVTFTNESANKSVKSIVLESEEFDLINEGKSHNRTVVKPFPNLLQSISNLSKPSQQNSCNSRGSKCTSWNPLEQCANRSQVDSLENVRANSSCFSPCDDTKFETREENCQDTPVDGRESTEPSVICNLSTTSDLTRSEDELNPVALSLLVSSSSFQDSTEPKVSLSSSETQNESVPCDFPMQLGDVDLTPEVQGICLSDPFHLNSLENSVQSKSDQIKADALKSGINALTSTDKRNGSMDVKCYDVEVGDNSSESQIETEENTADEDTLPKEETDPILELWRNWKNPVFHQPEKGILDIWSSHSVNMKLHRVTQSCHFTKSMLSRMETVGQVDNKFIACIVRSDGSQSKVPDQLLMIDQHAAHERVRLEQLTADMYHTEGCNEDSSIGIRYSKIVPPELLTFSDREMRVVGSFLSEFPKIGLRLEVQMGSNTVQVHTAPSCIVTREASELRNNRKSIAMDLVQTLIKEQIELLQDTHGAAGTLPKTIHNVLCSQACHGAIKFGAPLTLKECQNLLSMLVQCKLPFQCAHGRPSVIPLLNLQHFKSALEQSRFRKVNLKKLRDILKQNKTVGDTNFGSVERSASESVN